MKTIKVDGRTYIRRGGSRGGCNVQRLHILYQWLGHEYTTMHRG